MAFFAYCSLSPLKLVTLNRGENAQLFFLGILIFGQDWYPSIRTKSESMLLLLQNQLVLHFSKISPFSKRDVDDIVFLEINCPLIRTG